MINVSFTSGLYCVGRESYWTGHSSITPACYIGSDFWTTEPRVPKWRFNHYSSIRSPSENASTLDSPRDSTVHLCLLPWLVLWC